jgi:hypothetical protein
MKAEGTYYKKEQNELAGVSICKIASYHTVHKKCLTAVPGSSRLTDQTHYVLCILNSAYNTLSIILRSIDNHPK